MSGQAHHCTDIVIVGGGMVGASLAVALASSPYDITLVEGHVPDSATQPSFDDRTTALGNGSRAIFEGIGLWPALDPEAGRIRDIHVSDAGRFGFARLNASEFGLDALGYVIANRTIGRALWKAMEAQPRLRVLAPARAAAVRFAGEGAQEGVEVDVEAAGAATRTLRARLVVAADGANSAVRSALGLGATQEDYGQVALVANIATDRPAVGTAYERFAPSGPIALLPLADGTWTIVWALEPGAAKEIQLEDDTRFLARLQDAFGWRAGAFTRVGARSAYPLVLARSEQGHAARAVLIGNASQALHPVAGQGFNLGLRDAASLAEVLVEDAAAKGEARDPGATAVLERHAAWRAGDRSGMTRFTDTLVRVFGDARPGVKLLRDLALLGFDVAPPAKRALSRVSWGFGKRLPRLSRGARLDGR